MSRRYLTALSSVLYFICLISIIGMLGHAFNLLIFKHSEKVFLGIIIVISAYTATCFRCIGISNKNQRTKIIRRVLFCLFIFYLVMLIDFTLIDDSLGRNIYNIFTWDKKAFKHYIKESTNLVPFATVRLFINGYLNHNLSLTVMMENLVGNIIALMPFPFFITVIFKHFNKWYQVLITVLIAVILIELLQFVFLTGSTDVDDVILNVSGAMLFYGLLKTKKISYGISKLTFGVWETIENKA